MPKGILNFLSVYLTSAQCDWFCESRLKSSESESVLARKLWISWIQIFYRKKLALVFKNKGLGFFHLVYHYNWSWLCNTRLGQLFAHIFLFYGYLYKYIIELLQLPQGIVNIYNNMFQT